MVKLTSPPSYNIKKLDKRSRIRRLRKTVIATCTLPTIISFIVNGNSPAFSFSPRQLQTANILRFSSTSNSKTKRQFLFYSTTDPSTESESATEKSGISHDESQRISSNSGFFGMNDLMNKNAETLMIYNNDQLKTDTSNGFDVTKRNGKSQEKKETRSSLMRVKSKRPWRRRHARSIEEGLRNERVPQKKNQLEEYSSQIPFLSKLKETTQKTQKKKRFGARTVSGLISALAEESKGLQVEIDARSDTPISGKQIDTLTINFSRLGFKPIRIGGLNTAIRDLDDHISPSMQSKFVDSLSNSKVTLDEAFKRIDADNSGALDAEELANALDLAMETHSDKPKLAGMVDQNEKIPMQLVTGLASRLVSLYDSNGDEELDRDEYQNLIEDMSVLRKAYATKKTEKKNKKGFFAKFFRKQEINEKSINGSSNEIESSVTEPKYNTTQTDKADQDINMETAIDISNSDMFFSSVTGEGSIVLTDLKVDLRRILFGAVPLVKKITPGGPLILEPFTMTVSGSLNPDDILDSFLLNNGLKLLVARALRRRVRSFRDLVDGAVFYGRTWNMASKSAPIVDLPEITSIEFDEKDRAIISGRVRLRSSPDAPFVENAFKLRTKIGTRENGQVIRLKEPELAIVVECPKAWERNIVSVCKKFNLPVPRRPDPIYAYIPLVSPLAKNDKDGYNMGNDNCLQSIDIKDGALRVVMSAVLRPGRFLGNHYIAFTVPNRSVIVTLDRVKEGIRVARRNKRAADELLKEAQERALTERIIDLSGNSINERDSIDQNEDYSDSLSFVEENNESNSNIESDPYLITEGPEENKGFFNRFVQGYVEAAMSDKNAEKRREKLASAMSEWFGRKA